jgi:hypothetical protein
MVQAAVNLTAEETRRLLAVILIREDIGAHNMISHDNRDAIDDMISRVVDDGYSLVKQAV